MGAVEGVPEDGTRGGGVRQDEPNHCRHAALIDIMTLAPGLRVGGIVAATTEIVVAVRRIVNVLFIVVVDDAIEACIVHVDVKDTTVGTYEFVLTVVTVMGAAILVSPVVVADVAVVGAAAVVSPRSFVLAGMAFVGAAAVDSPVSFVAAVATIVRVVVVVVVQVNRPLFI